MRTIIYKACLDNFCFLWTINLAYLVRIIERTDLELDKDILIYENGRLVLLYDKDRNWISMTRAPKENVYV